MEEGSQEGGRQTRGRNGEKGRRRKSRGGKGKTRKTNPGSVLTEMPRLRDTADCVTMVHVRKH